MALSKINDAVVRKRKICVIYAPMDCKFERSKFTTNCPHINSTERKIQPTLSKIKYKAAANRLLKYPLDGGIFKAIITPSMVDNIPREDDHRAVNKNADIAKGECFFPDCSRINFAAY